MYIEIDHKLVARHIADINKTEDLPGRKKETIPGGEKFALFKEYNLKNENIADILQKKYEKLEWAIGSNEKVWYDLHWLSSALFYAEVF